MDIKGVGHIQADPGQRCALLLIANAGLPFAQRVAGKCQHLKGARNCRRVVQSLGDRQAALRRLERFLMLILMPV